MGKAQQIWDARRKLTAEIRTLNARGIPLSPEELLGIRQQEGKLSAFTQDFRYQLSRDAYSWPQVINFLGRLPDPEAAHQVMEAVRDLLSPSVAGDVALLLSSDAPAGVRRLALAALASQDSGTVLSALARMASEDPQSTLRKEALQSLALRKSRLSADDGRALVEDTLRRQSAADPDAGARDCARALLEANPPSSRPNRPTRSNRGALGWGS